MLQFITVILLLFSGGGWLFDKCCRWPNATRRIIALLIGLFLVGGMGYMLVIVVTSPEHDGWEACVLLPWIGLGIWFILQAVKK